MEGVIRDGAVGAEATAQTVVTREVTVAHFHPEMPEVYGTPFMIYLMEVAAASALHPFLPPGWVSVGARVDVRHLAATPVGCTVTATARVLEVDGRQASFAVTAHDGSETIGEGRHVRVAIDPARGAARLAAKMATAAGATPATPPTSAP